MADSKPAVRRRHTDEVKARVLSECARSGASVARIALAHGLNANLVHKWRRGAGRGVAAVRPVRQSGEFIPLTLTPSATPPAGDIRIEMRRGAITVSISWPVASAAQCAAWMREVLR